MPRAGNRSRLLLVSEHGSKEVPLELPVPFLMAFVLRMIRLSSSDAVYLCAMDAARDIGLTPEQGRDFLQVLAFAEATIQDQRANSPWPEGFMG